jgi:hypothetical protein
MATDGLFFGEFVATGVAYAEAIIMMTPDKDSLGRSRACRTVLVGLLAIFFFLSSPSALASSTASISGTVSDPSGAVVNSGWKRSMFQSRAVLRSFRGEWQHQQCQLRSGSECSASETRSVGGQILVLECRGRVATSSIFLVRHPSFTEWRLKAKWS